MHIILSKEVHVISSDFINEKSYHTHFNKCVCVHFKPLFRIKTNETLINLI